MEWLILVVVLPLLLVPLVLVFGFAGCGLEAVGTLLPVATNLTAKAVFVGNQNTIMLSWIGSAGAKYVLLRGVDGPPLSATPTDDDKATTFTDGVKTKLNEGTKYVYQVQALTGGGTPGGLSNKACATTLPAAPSLANALPKTTSHIELNWLKISTKGTLFRIERLDPPQIDFKYRNETSSQTFQDGVAEGGTYLYRVFDIVEDGCDESIPKAQVLSPPSNVVVGKPLAFAAGFGAAPIHPNLHNHCLVQRIRVTGTGSQIRLTIAGSGSVLTLDRICISRVSVGGNPWDAADLEQIDQKVTLQPGDLARVIGPFNYPISAFPVDLLVAFDINATVGQGDVRFVNIPAAQAYTLSYAANPGIDPQAGIEDRVPAFQTIQGRHYLVEKIEVF
jgi:hypothetical protein